MKGQEFSLIQRLREGRTNGTELRWRVSREHLEAADEIERLTRELAEAREAFDKLHAKWSNQRVTLQTIFGKGAGEPKP